MLDIPKKLYWTFWGMSHHRNIRDNARRRSGKNSNCK